MSENTIELNDENFDSKIKKGNWVVDFWADWCGPCKMMAPYFDDAAKSYKGKVNFGKVDVDANPQLSERFEILSIPTIIVFKDGEIVNQKAGAITNKEQIAHFVDNSL